MVPAPSSSAQRSSHVPNAAMLLPLTALQFAALAIPDDFTAALILAATSLLSIVARLYCIGTLHVWLRDVTNGQHPISPVKSWALSLVPVYGLFWTMRWMREVVALENRLTGDKATPDGPGTAYVAAALASVAVGMLTEDPAIAVVLGALLSVVQIAILVVLLRRIRSAVEGTSSSVALRTAQGGGTA